jgi:hypothetical protein
VVRPQGTYLRSVRGLVSDPPHGSSWGSAVGMLVPDPAETWARAKLRGITATGADWEALGSERPNGKAKNIAREVLTAAYSLRPLEPTYVTVSADGGIGIVYRAEGKYAAFECLNSGTKRFLWFDANGEPHSRRVNTERGIKKALKLITLLHADAGTR